MTYLSCLGCPPGKSPLGVLTHFPLQSGQGLGGSWSKTSLWPCPHKGNTLAKFFSPISPMKMATNLPLAIVQAAGPLGEVQRLI